ncbi:class I SAM-dependent methyltransferase [Macrococcus epidermidis]|uniref:Class I SAM-dependent methyltransferase n=1 Tax=Macrococcus epidermidis TaxID=1902580 RepID=A0A327ZN02_9STAP|nr:class I SAM-dependent methyltransferase [Macrococcus epidermidis]RAK43779.1 class I SAM-dependent methyltransferase [Macrococcus epidermidis]
MREFDAIRSAEIEYHDAFYKSTKLYEPGSWIGKPVANVMEAFEMIDISKPLKILDLGSGVGRNAIAIAQMSIDGTVIDCVDLLPSAIEILNDNAKAYHVKDKINGIVSTIEDYQINKEYDFIIGVSTLEHVNDEAAFKKILKNIKNHLVINGVACLIINSEVQEKDIETGELLVPQFEVNMLTKDMQKLVHDIFVGFEFVKEEIKLLNYRINRAGKDVNLSTNAVTFIIRRTI